MNLNRDGQKGLTEAVFAMTTSDNHLLCILVFDDQHNQVGLMDLQVIVL